MANREAAQQTYNLNPAGRLFQVLDRALRFSGESGVRDAWGQALGLDLPVNLPEVYQRTAALYDSYLSLKAYCEATKPAGHFWLEIIPKVELATVPATLTGQFGSHKSLIVPEVIFLIRTVADEMVVEEPIPQDDLRGLREAIEAIRAEIDKSNVSQVFRRWLLELLRAMRDSIDRYEIHGARGLRSSLYRIAGELAGVYRDRKSKAAEGDVPADAELSAMESTWEVVKKVDVVTAIAARIPPLCASLSNSGTRLLDFVGPIAGLLP